MILKQTTWAMWNPNVGGFTILGKSPREVWEKMHGPDGIGEKFNHPLNKHQRKIWREYGFQCMKVEIKQIPPRKR